MMLDVVDSTKRRFTLYLKQLELGRKIIGDEYFILKDKGEGHIQTQIEKS